MSHVVQWVTASPLWDDAVNESANPEVTVRERRMREPALLRFENDSFMEELAHLLDTTPETLKTRRADPRTYRLKAPGETGTPTIPDLKLYQAVHGHFYLVAATLVCRLPGLPEHEVLTTQKETVTFVLRRIAEGSEWAWSVGPDPAQPTGWTEIAAKDVATPAADEQLLPLFPMAFTTSDRKRKLYVGLIPTSSAEAFKAAGKFSPLPASPTAPGDPGKDPRTEELDRILTRPMQALAAPPLTPSTLPEPDKTKAAQSLELQKQEASSYVLIDLAEFLQVHAKAVWGAVHGSATVTKSADAALLSALSGLHPDTSHSGITWRSALKDTWDAQVAVAGTDTPIAAPKVNLGRSDLSGTSLAGLIANVLEPIADLPKPPPVGGVTSAGSGAQPEAPTVPKLQPQDTAAKAVQYMIRCVYTRPQCEPMAHAKLVSEPSEQFILAPFFDPDAPARSIQITMPLDTSIAGLRKHRKNVNVLISKELRAQMSRVADLKNAMDGNFASGDSFDLGIMCSFSIPIITICALLVLMIFISLLNIVFWWAPFLKICFPIGLEAKKA